jgi:hypothetical protein
MQAGVLDSLTLRPTGYADVAYAYCFNKPTGNMVPYSTTPARYNEFMLTMGRVGLRTSNADVRGALVFHAGTFVDANYVGADAAWKYVQEATVGARVSGGLWVDAGIFPAHIGFESMAPAENWTYSRSLIADYTPYYETGVKLTWAPSAEISLTGLVLNGWQNIVDNNPQKSVGTQLVWTPSSSFKFNWSTFLGTEANASGYNSTRVHNNFFGVITAVPSLDIALLGDFCMQQGATGETGTMWYAGSIIRFRATDQVRIAARGESYNDPDGVMVLTGTESPFETMSASLNLDIEPMPGLLWRLEGRYYMAPNAIFPSNDGIQKTNTVASTSLSLTF